MKNLLNHLEELFDKYHGKQLEINDRQNADYYLFMGKANAIGECIDLMKLEMEGISLAEFKTSTNAIKLASKLNNQFNLELLPKIKRYIKDDIKFLMITEDNRIYEFKGTVLDFLSSKVTIELEEGTDKGVFILK
jgi:hypothetical protein